MLQWITITSVYFLLSHSHQGLAGRIVHRVRRSVISDNANYNRTEEQTPQGFHYKIGVVSDLDKKSKVRNTETKSDEWISYFITANLYVQYNPENLKEANVTIEWEENEPEILKYSMAYGGRGQELSELITFAGRLLTCDDRTGIVYSLIRVNKTKGTSSWKQVPWVILAGGDGTLSKGFKCEWATVKDGKLYIGSHGSLRDLEYVKEITDKGEVRTLDWADHYNKLAIACGITRPGYISHEAVGWSDYHRKWVFIPRKVNPDQFEESADSHAASNMIISANEDFTEINVNNIAGEFMPTHGVTSFKWLPLAGTNHSYIIALKAEEIGDHQASYILAFDMDGDILFPETKIHDLKYEGLEFI